MAKFEKGLPRPVGAGRKAGTPNKSTAQFKDAISELIARNQGNLQIWLDTIAKDDPAKAFDLLIKVMEFVIPKLSRTEYKDPAKEESATQISIEFVGYATPTQNLLQVDNANNTDVL